MVGENICSWFPVIRDRADNVRPINSEQKFIWSSVYVEAFELTSRVCFCPSAPPMWAKKTFQNTFHLHFIKHDFTFLGMHYYATFVWIFHVCGDTFGVSGTKSAGSGFVTEISHSLNSLNGGLSCNGMINLRRGGKNISSKSIVTAILCTRRPETFRFRVQKTHCIFHKLNILVVWLLQSSRPLCLRAEILARASKCCHANVTKVSEVCWATIRTKRHRIGVTSLSSEHSLPDAAPLLLRRHAEHAECSTPCMEMPLMPVTKCCELNIAGTKHEHPFSSTHKGIRLPWTVLSETYCWHDVRALVCIDHQLLTWQLRGCPEQSVHARARLPDCSWGWLWGGLCDPLHVSSRP